MPWREEEEFPLKPFDLLSRIRFAILYEIPPRIKPIITGGITFTKLNASSIRENVKAAISTPLPKAITDAIMLLGRLTEIATIEPMRRGILAIKPQITDSNMVWVVIFS
jgi:hypothetical protein